MVGRDGGIVMPKTAFVVLAMLALSACASNRTSMQDPVTTGSISGDATSLAQMAARYKAHPRDKVTIIYYAAALRAAGQPDADVAIP